MTLMVALDGMRAVGGRPEDARATRGPRLTSPVMCTLAVRCDFCALQQIMVPLRTC